jgi:hypothetical protein
MTSDVIELVLIKVQNTFRWIDINPSYSSTTKKIDNIFKVRDIGEDN